MVCYFRRGLKVRTCERFTLSVFVSLSYSASLAQVSPPPFLSPSSTDSTFQAADVPYTDYLSTLPSTVSQPPPSGPQLQEQSEYPPCAFCATQLDDPTDPTDNPIFDSPTSEEMNLKINPLPRTVFEDSP